MYSATFEDYIELYKNINTEEWITIFEENEEKKYENDIFTFCALADVDKINEGEYLKNFEWGFSTDSFGKSGFGTYYSSGNEELFFNDGQFNDNFEYLIALRYFEKYETSVEINPKLIWYYNLAKTKDGYVDPTTDELVIRLNPHKIEVRRAYLKDFLCAYQKVAVIVFDHRRYFNRTEEIKYIFKDIFDKHFFLNLNIAENRGFGSNFDSISCIIGKVVIFPFKNPRHIDYKYFIEENEFEKFIVGYDEDEDETIEYTCNEKELANYFGANPQAPHFLTATYFDIKVLDKYKNDPRNYKITDSNISFLSDWSIPFSINEENKVVVWLGDLGRIPIEEQKYWKAFNVKPKGGIEKNFFERQIKSIWTDASRIESKLVPTLNRINSIIHDKYGDVLFSVLSEADKEIYSTFMLPTNLSMPEYQSFLMKLSKLVAESINTRIIKTVMDKDYPSQLGSVLQLGKFLEYIELDINGAICSSIKKAYDSRNKLAGHKASISSYNKVWGREESFKFNSIEDARSLLEDIIGSIEYAIQEK